MRFIDLAGFDAGKKIKGKKRHLLVDTQGLLMRAIVHAADIQDRDGGVLLMSSLFGLFPFLLKLYADSGYQGPKFQQGLGEVCLQVTVEIVKRSDASKFVVLPKRWIVERTIWLVEPMPPSGEGLGVPESKRPHVPSVGVYPVHAQKAPSNYLMISDGL